MTPVIRPPAVLVFSWLAALVLLSITVIAAYLPLGAGNTIVALLIAFTKAAIVAAVFMELRRQNGFIITFATAGFFWLAILFWLAFTDYSTRANFPPTINWGL
ncbi:MAG TPA: cytochrome C oxidase subunit IV family protein [Pseudolabrys sp.]|nr:cytochrome C oxidase subunit IV family protein [Pseudolabrys sp.]